MLYILLSLEAFSLLIGSLLLFAALAGVMYATRRIDWGAQRGTRPAEHLTVCGLARLSRVDDMTDRSTAQAHFPDAKVDAQAAEHVPSSPQTESAAYKLAFQDTDFLLREDLAAGPLPARAAEARTAARTRRRSPRPSSSTARRAFPSRRRPTR